MWSYQYEPTLSCRKKSRRSLDRLSQYATRLNDVSRCHDNFQVLLSIVPETEGETTVLRPKWRTPLRLGDLSVAHTRTSCICFFIKASRNRHVSATWSYFHLHFHFTESDVAQSVLISYVFCSTAFCSTSVIRYFKVGGRATSEFRWPASIKPMNIIAPSGTDGRLRYIGACTA